MQKVWHPIATAPVDVDLELSMMTMANITHSRFPVGAMARAGATYVPVVPYRLSQPIGGFGIAARP